MSEQVRDKRGPGLSAPLEREAEIDELDRLVQVAPHDGARLLIEGSAGIGKTTLLKALKRRACEAGFDVMTARGSELEREFAFGVVRQLFEARVTGLSPAERAEIFSGAAALARGVVWPRDSNTREQTTSAEGTLHGLYWLVVNLAERAPLLLAIDDVHLVDAPSLDFLEYLARRLEGLPVLVALAARTGEPDEEPARLRALSEGTVLSPPPLSLQATSSLTREVLGDVASDDICAACHRATGGNPFLLGELLAELRDQAGHGRSLSAEEVPTVHVRSVAALVAGRLTSIGGVAQAVATALAVLGDGADVRQLAALAEVPVDAARRAADGLAGAMIVSPSAPLAFLHPLLRAAVYGEIGPGERALLHARAARLLADGAARGEAIATHLLVSERAGDPWVVSVLRDAARTAHARGAPEIAASYLRRALDEPPATSVRPDVLAELGTAEVLSGDPIGVEHLRSALEGSSAGTHFARTARMLAQGLIPFGRLEEAVAVLDTAIDQLSDEERELALELEAEAASAGRMSRSTFTRTVERLRPFEQQLAGDTPGERLILANLAAQQLVAGTAREASSLAERALGGGLLAERTSASATVYDALVPAVVADAFGLAERYCDAGLVDARARGSQRDVSLNLMFRSHLAYRAGRVVDATTDASEAFESALDAGFIFAMTAAAFLIDALIERGELAAAAATLVRAGAEEDIPDTWMTDWLLYSRGMLRLAQGDLDGGLGDLGLLGRREDGYLGSNPGVYPYRSSMAVALTQRGDRERARDLALEELDLARAWGTPRSIGIALRAVGLAEGHGAGLERLLEAVSILEPSGAELERARALTDLGTALRKAGQRIEARKRLEEGMDVAHRCGATVLAERARDELVAAGARPRRLALTGLDALTARERRVAQMAAVGLTNKEIAQALFVTIRTVEMHLGNTYRKLDISSRAELKGFRFGMELS